MSANHVADADKLHVLVSSVRQLAGSLLTQATNVINLDNIGKSSRALITTQLSETLTHMQDQGSKVLSAVKTSKQVYNNLQSLQVTLTETQRFFTDLDSTQMVFLSKSKFKTKCRDLANSMMAKRTQLFSSVTMALVSGPLRGGGPKLPPGVRTVSSASTGSSPMATAGGVSSSGVADAAMRMSGGLSVAASSPASSVGGGAYDFSDGAIGRAAGAAAGGVGLDDERVLAMHGHSDHMMYSAGYAYYYGVGRPRNCSLAKMRFQEAADVGDADAMMMLVKCYTFGHGVDKSMERARHWLSEAVASGSAAAKTELASLLLMDTLPDPATLQFLRNYIATTAVGAKAAAGGGGRGGIVWKGLRRRSLGDFVNAFAGASGATATTRAVAAAAADGDSTFVPLSENERNAFCKQGVNLLLDAASNGDLQAQTNLGLVNQEAGNVHDAYKWFLAASNDGCPRATNLLGLLLLHGSGTPDGKKDEHKAYALFISASRGGDLDSLYNAGTCCENGLLSESFHQRSSPNLQLALRFYESGAAEGHLECTYSFGYLLLRQAVELLAERAPGEDRRTAVEHYLTPKEQAWYESTAAQGIHFLRVAADRGLADARYQLGRAYMAGIGVPQDVHAAYEAFQFACNSPVIVGSQEQHGNSQDWIKSGGATAHARASLEAGNILFSGFGSGFPSQQELEQAARMYAIASRAGNADAMNSLALLLEDGRVGVESTSNGDGSIKNLHEDDATAHSHARLHMAVRYYMCAATHGHADAMLNLTHLLASGAVDVGLTRGLVTLPLDHGSAGDVLLQNNPSSGATGAAKGAGSGLFGYVRGTSSSTISGGDGERRIVLPWTEVACWLVDNAVLPEHSPLSAQDYSDALAYLERLSRSSSSGTAGPHDVNASVDNDSDYSADADCDYLGALHRAEMESVEKAAAAAQRVDEERKAGRALVAEVMGSVKKAPPPVADIASASLTPHAPQMPSKEHDPYSPPPALATSSRAGKHSSSVSVPTSSSAEHTPMAGKYSSSSGSSSSPRDTLSESASKTPRAGKFSTNNSAPASRTVGRESPNPLGSEAASALEREKAAHQQAVSSFSAPSSDSVVSSPGSSPKLGQARVIPVVSRSPVSESKPTATSTSTTTAVEESKESAGTVSVPIGYSMPPSKLHSVGNKSLVGNSTGDSKPQMLLSSQPSPVPVPVVVTKSKPSKKGGSFLTSIGTDLEASTDADASISGVASPATMDRTGTGSLDLSASTMAPTPAASKPSARPVELELSEVDTAADYDEAEFSGALPSARGKGEEGEKEEDRPPKPPKRAGAVAVADKPEKKSSQKQLSLERPKPSVSPANTGTGSAVNKAAAAAMFEEVEEDDSEFEFSSMSMSRDSNLNASYSSIGASVGAGGAGKLATSVDSSSRVGKGPKPKPKPPKKKTKLPPRNLTSLNSSFEFDSSFG